MFFLAAVLLAGCSRDESTTSTLVGLALTTLTTAGSTTTTGPAGDSTTAAAASTTSSAARAGAARLYPASPVYDLPEGTKRGYIDERGDWVVERRFDWQREFSEGLAAVDIEGKIGFIDVTGKVVIEPRFADAGSFSQGLAAVQEPDGRPGYIDQTGAWVIEPRVRWGTSRVGAADPFSEGLAGVTCFSADSIQTGVGFIDKSGAWVIEPNPGWSQAYPFSEGLAQVHVWRTGLVGFIDKTGRVIVKPQYGWAGDFSEGLAAVRKDVGKELHDWAYIDRTGATVLSFSHEQYVDAQPFCEGLAGLGAYDENGRAAFGFIDKAGSWVIEPRFSWCMPFSEGLAAVCLDGKWGYIDKRGACIIEPRFATAEPFHGDLAWVTLEGVRGYVDKTGVFVYSETWKRPKGPSGPL